MLGSVQVHILDFVLGFALGAISMYIYHMITTKQNRNLTFQAPEKRMETPAIEQPNISPGI